MGVKHVPSTWHERKASLFLAATPTDCTQRRIVQQATKGCCKFIASYWAIVVRTLSPPLLPAQNSHKQMGGPATMLMLFPLLFSGHVQTQMFDPYYGSAYYDGGMTGLYGGGQQSCGGGGWPLEMFSQANSAAAAAAYNPYFYGMGYGPGASLAAAYGNGVGGFAAPPSNAFYNPFNPFGIGQPSAGGGAGLMDLSSMGGSPPLGIPLGSPLGGPGLNGPPPLNPLGNLLSALGGVGNNNNLLNGQQPQQLPPALFQQQQSQGTFGGSNNNAGHSAATSIGNRHFRSRFGNGALQRSADIALDRLSPPGSQSAPGACTGSGFLFGGRDCDSMKD